MNNSEIKTFRFECQCGNVLYVDAEKGDDKINIVCPECGRKEAMSYDYLEDMESGGEWS